MAANEETVCIDTIKKTLWDSLKALGENISGETLSALMDIIESGGGGELLVTFTVDNDTVTADVTVAEIIAAAQAGTPVRGKLPQEGGYAYVPLIYADSTTALFTALSYGQSGFIQNGLIGKARETDTWQLITE